MTSSLPIYNSQDRLLAAGAHASFLVNIVVPGFGAALTCLLIWGLYRERPFVAFHAIQALIVLIVKQLVGILTVVILIAMLFGNEALTLTELGIEWRYVFYTVGGCLSLGTLLLQLLAPIAAIIVFRGGDFNYPIIGPALRRYFEEGDV
jgi:uncharacterized membrane protein